jgi:23S rRNA pseudouridine2605 synthase
MKNKKPVSLLPEKIRLNRFISNSGLCSRRDADEHIKNSFISVNGKIITNLATHISTKEDVRFKNKK